jgi:hypothetical protein
MVDYSKFILALKSSWIRRLIHSESKWVKLLQAQLQTNITNLWLMGSNFITKLCNKITNNFWIDVFRSWLEIWCIEQQRNMKIHKEHIWYNPRLIIGKASVFLKSYFNAG